MFMRFKFKSIFVFNFNIFRPISAGHPNEHKVCVCDIMKCIIRKEMREIWKWGISCWKWRGTKHLAPLENFLLCQRSTVLFIKIWIFYYLRRRRWTHEIVSSSVWHNFYGNYRFLFNFWLNYHSIEFEILSHAFKHTMTLWIVRDLHLCTSYISMNYKQDFHLHVLSSSHTSLIMPNIITCNFISFFSSYNYWICCWVIENTTKWNSSREHCLLFVMKKKVKEYGKIGNAFL
jgi:hypothetical protein